MTTIMAFIRKHPLLSYFTLTFAITWGGFLTAVGPGGIPATKGQFTTMPLGAILAALVGPSVSGILLTGLLYGREGYRNLFSRITKWRVGARWYALALLTASIVFTAVLIPLSFISPVFLPGIFASDAKVSFVLMGIVVALIVGIFEELGWTGFPVPTLLGLRYGVGSVAPPWERHLGKRRYLRRVPSSPLRGLDRLESSCRRTASLQGAYGVGLRA